MRPSDRDMTQLGPWISGANNLALETSVPRRSFRQGTNVDVTDDGKIVRRPGRELAISSADPSNLFGYGRRGFFVEGRRLFAFSVDNGAETPPLALYDGLRPDARIAHALIDPDIFISDGAVCLRVAADNTVAPWSVPTPQPPALQAAAGGTLAAGRYHVAVAYRAPTGEESPLSEPEAIDVDDGAAVTLDVPPLPGHRVVIYMTKQDGSELLRLATFPGGTVGITRQNLGRPSPTAGMDPMPPGEFALLWNGRLLTAQDRLVFWSEPMQYGLTQLMYNYIELVEPITMLAAPETAEGFFVGQQSRTYFVAGADPTESVLTEAYPAGVVPGTMQVIPGARLPFEEGPSGPLPIWLATNGVFCAGLPDGRVAPLTENRYAALRSEEGASMFFPSHGINKYVTTLRDPKPNNLALSDAFTAEVVRTAPRGP